MENILSVCENGALTDCKDSDVINMRGRTVNVLSVASKIFQVKIYIVERNF